MTSSKKKLPRIITGPFKKLRYVVLLAAIVKASLQDSGSLIRNGGQRILQQKEPTKLQSACIKKYDASKCSKSGVHPLEFWQYPRDVYDEEQHIIRMGVWIGNYNDDPYELIEQNDLKKVFELKFEHSGFEEDGDWKGKDIQEGDEDYENYDDDWNYSNDDEYGYDEEQWDNEENADWENYDEEEWNNENEQWYGDEEQYDYGDEDAGADPNAGDPEDPGTAPPPEDGAVRRRRRSLASYNSTEVDRLMRRAVLKKKQLIGKMLEVEHGKPRYGRRYKIFHHGRRRRSRNRRIANSTRIRMLAKRDSLKKSTCPNKPRSPLKKRKMQEDNEFGYEGSLKGVEVYFYASDGSITLEMQFSDSISATKFDLTVKNPFLLYNRKDFFIAKATYSSSIDLVSQPKLTKTLVKQ